MTETRGRVARWSAAALAAPVAAGLFAGTTAWASGHDPLHPDGAPAPPVPAAAATEDPSLAALRAQLAAQTTALQRLSKQVAAVRAQALALSGRGGRHTSGGVSSGGGAGGSSGGRSSTGTSSGHHSSSSSTASSGSHGSGQSSGGSSGSGGGTTTAPKPSPPPTQGGTGASGSPK